MQIIEGTCGWMSPRAKILGLEPLGPQKVYAYAQINMTNGQPEMVM